MKIQKSRIAMVGGLLLAATMIQGCGESEKNDAQGETNEQGGAMAYDSKYQKLTDYLDTLHTNSKLMGSLAMRVDGEMVYEHQFGYRNVASKVEPDVSTRYQIGSITKTYTATIIMKLIEAGMLELDDKLATYFSSIPNAENITIHHLLAHESGIFNFTNSPDYLEYMYSYVSQEDLVAKIAGFESDFTPGEKMEYSNSNYVLLGFIIEKLTGASYEDAVNQYIVEPLNLTETVIGDGLSESENEAFSYKFAGEWELEGETVMSIPGAAGAISASSLDVVKFYEALFNGEIVSKTTLDKMIEPRGFGYGLAFMPFYDKEAYGHGGAIDGFVSNAAYIEEDKLALTLVTNGVNYNTNDAMIAILSAFYNKPYEIPEFVAKEPVGEYDVNDYVGTYASPDLPLKIDVFVKEGELFAQATGQGPFPLTATAKEEFSFVTAGIVMEFDLSKNQFVLNQGGGQFTFTKE